MIIPSISFSQEGGYQRASKRIEEAVRQGQITREQANERYRNLEQRLQNQGKRGQRSNNIAFHFEKLGIKNIDNIKLKLKNQGVTDTHIESILGGMIRVVDAEKNEVAKAELKFIHNKKKTKKNLNFCILHSFKYLCIVFST